MKILIDTNVILDAIIKREPFDVSAGQIFIMAAGEKFNATITANSITDIFYIVSKSYGNKEKAKELLRGLFETFDICSISYEDLNNALEMEMRDFEDALIVACAKRLKCDYIITRNIKDFENSTVPTILPDDFLRDYIS